MQSETILNVFPAHDDQNRLVVAIEHHSGKGNRLVLRQETLSNNVGWFVQSCIAIEPEQLPGLKMTLTSNSTRSLQPKASEITRGPATLRFSEFATGQVG